MNLSKFILSSFFFITAFSAWGKPASAEKPNIIFILADDMGIDSVSANNEGEITLSWIATDVDSDIATYTLFMDTDDASTEVTQLAYTSGNMQYNIAVESNQTYRWRVVTLDQTGNTSDSGTYGFRVN